MCVYAAAEYPSCLILSLSERSAAFHLSFFRMTYRYLLFLVLQLTPTRASAIAALRQLLGER